MGASYNVLNQTVFHIKDVDSNNNIFTVERSETNLGPKTIFNKFDESLNNIFENDLETYLPNSGAILSSLFIDNSDNIYILFTTFSPFNDGTNPFVQTGSIDVVIMKFNNDGNLIYIKQDNTFNTTGDNSEVKGATDSDNNLYIFYTTSGSFPSTTNTGSLDTVLIKLNENGIVQWITQNNTFNTIENDFPDDLTISIDGNNYVYCLIKTNGTITGQTKVLDNSDLALLKFDSSGNLLNIKQDVDLNFSNGDSSYFSGNNSIILDSDNNIIIVYSTINSDFNNALISAIKLDNNFNIIWKRDGINEFNLSSLNDAFLSIHMDYIINTKNIFIALVTQSDISSYSNKGSFDIVFLHLNPDNGNIKELIQNGEWNTPGNDGDNVNFVIKNGILYLSNTIEINFGSEKPVQLFKISYNDDGGNGDNGDNGENNIIKRKNISITASSDSNTNRIYSSIMRNILNFNVESNYNQNQVNKQGKTFDSSYFTNYKKLIAIRRNLYN